MMLEITGLDFSYRKGMETLKGLDLKVGDGEVFSLLGGSGTGKTTILNLIAGFERPDRGSIKIDGEDVIDVPPERRRVGMVFQDHALFPHLDVRRNILYGARRTDREKLLTELIRLVGLEGKERRMPYSLSGGERQRVALARTLAYFPKLVLLDEPLSSLDPSLRVSLRKELRTILKERGVTSIHVTHDQTDAMAISDRIGILDKGSVLEEGTPRRLYDRPVNSSTARFMGIENIFPVKNDGGSLLTPFGRVPWKGKVPELMGIRSERLKTSGPGFAFKAKVLSTEFRGRDLHLVIEVGGARMEALVDPGSIPKEKMDLWVQPEDLILLEPF